MSVYAENKAKSRTKNTRPTMTDQAQASETDRNVIVKKFMVHGQLPQVQGGFFADFTTVPQHLMTRLNWPRAARYLRQRLPEQLRGKTMDELASLSIEQINEILKPAESPPKKDEGDKTS